MRICDVNHICQVEDTDTDLTVYLSHCIVGAGGTK